MRTHYDVINYIIGYPFLIGKWRPHNDASSIALQIKTQNIRKLKQKATANMALSEGWVSRKANIPLQMRDT